MITRSVDLFEINTLSDHSCYPSSNRGWEYFSRVSLRVWEAALSETGGRRRGPYVYFRDREGNLGSPPHQSLIVLLPRLPRLPRISSSSSSSSFSSFSSYALTVLREDPGSSTIRDWGGPPSSL